MRQFVLAAAEQVTVLTIAPQPLLSAARADPAYVKFGADARKDAVIKAHELASEEAALLGGEVFTQPEAHWGHPIDQILRAARSTRADLIVLGAKGIATSAFFSSEVCRKG
jgi:nucleotide-binding universal stress UspA family protein